MAFLNMFIDLWTYTFVNRYCGDPTPRRSTGKNDTLHAVHFFKHTLKNNVHGSGTQTVL